MQLVVFLIFSSSEQVEGIFPSVFSLYLHTDGNDLTLIHKLKVKNQQEQQRKEIRVKLDLVQHT